MLVVKVEINKNAHKGGERGHTCFYLILDELVAFSGDFHMERTAYNLLSMFS